MVKKILLGFAGLILLVLGTTAAYVSYKWDKQYDVPAPALTASSDSAVIAHGRYLVRGPSHCAACHISDWSVAARVDAGEEVPMVGGVVLFAGPLGTMRTSNITTDSATGIGRYSDAQLFRFLRHSVKPDGRAMLWPLMPFHMMADSDLVAIVSYLRTQQPVRNEVAASDYTMLGKVIRSFADAFQPRIGHTAPATPPAVEQTLQRGEYISRYVANCVGCHTHYDDRGTKVGEDFGGGQVFPTEAGLPGAEPGVMYRSPNITRDSSGVLLRFADADAWITRFRTGRVHAGSPMPWGPFSRMSDSDLRAVWEYLNSIEPVRSPALATVFRDSTVGR